MQIGFQVHTKLTYLFLGAVFALACSDPTSQPPGDIQRSSFERDRAPDVSSTAQTTLVAGNKAFATDLYRELAQTDGNIFYSPLSISIALAMTFGGARGDTETQMATALHFDLPQSELHPAFNWLDLALQNPDGVDSNYRFDITNGIFGQTKFPFSSEYVDLIAVNYDSVVSLLDFMSDPEGARKDINRWVADATEGRIPELFAPRTITGRSRLVLTNAVYFKAPWKYPFAPGRTGTGTFQTPSGDIEVPMMRGRPRGSSYARGDGYEAIALPYEGDVSDFVIIMPDDLSAFEASLDAARLTEILSALDTRNQILTIPTFTFRFKADLKAPMQSLGMVDAFDERANFSGLTDAAQLFLSVVVHEAFVVVDEAGTEATAATGVVAEPVSLPPQVTVDRPFLFVIREIDTGSVLFLGRVVDPSA